MKPFGDNWVDPAAEQEMRSPARGGAAAPTAHEEPAAEEKSTGMMVPMASAALAMVVIFFVVSGAGASEGEATNKPKSVVFLFEGLKGNVFESLAIDGNRAPNMNRLVRDGSHAPCASVHDPRCSRAQSGYRNGKPWSWQAAPGLLSILTGVDAEKHLVANNSIESMTNYATVADEYPTFLSTLAKAGKKTAAVGTAALLTSVNADTGACSNYGILDFECGAEDLKRCVNPSSCNLNHRVALSTEEKGMPDAGEVVENVEAFFEAGADVVVVHLNNLDVAGTTTGDFTADSAPYAAQLYLVDAVVGQVMALVNRRAVELRENWLVVGASDHGGYEHASGEKVNEDDITAFFASVVTPAGPLKLNEPRRMTRQMDVAPTVLQWFGLAAPQLIDRMDGRVQCICTTGAKARNCTDADL
jgi:hypothetical protein